MDDLDVLLKIISEKFLLVDDELYAIQYSFFLTQFIDE
jgi:hypothetical protein